REVLPEGAGHARGRATHAGRVGRSRSGSHRRARGIATPAVPARSPAGTPLDSAPPSLAASPGPSGPRRSPRRGPYTPSNRFRTRRQNGGDRRENKATKRSGQGLADQRTAECRALGGSRQECPGRQENGGEGSRESCTQEGRDMANKPFTLQGRESVTP